VKPQDLTALIDRLRQTIASSSKSITVAIVGYTPTAIEMVQNLADMQLLSRVTGIYTSGKLSEQDSDLRRPIERLAADNPDVVIIASDDEKEALLLEAVPHLTPRTRILIGGFAHFQFRDALFEAETATTLIPSFANGYPNSLVHIFQCLKNAARLNLAGIVVEFGMFKGGTTMLMSRFIEKLGRDWKVYGFDSFAGFPSPRSPLDMYAHPDCVYLDEALVRRMFADRNVEIVAGDIVQTVHQIKNMPVVLAFVDTDNFTSADAVLNVIQNHVIPGGAIVFDHFTGRDRFLYTLGERIAAKRLLEDEHYFNLHDTGVFLRQR
jgi:O-methyltransferase